MQRKIMHHLLALLAIGLLVSCQTEQISLAEPTARPSQPAPQIEEPTSSPSATLAPTAEAKPLAELIDLKGVGRWRTSGIVDWDAAQIGQALQIENQVLTETSARVVIQYPDGLLVHVAPKTLFTVTDLEQAEDQSLRATIQLVLGELFVSHTGAQGSQIHIQTEAGIAGVRGTMMSVKVTVSGMVVVTCLEGTCTLENEHGMLVLEAGKQAELLNAATPPVFLGLISDYQLNEWFTNLPDALSVALNSGLLTVLPPGCTLENSLACQIDLTCDPNSGVGCPLPADCNPQTGLSCELAGGCNLVTGEGCELPPECDPLNGQGCRLQTGCNPVSGQGCGNPLSCDPISGSGCLPGTGCNAQTGQGCELPSGCNLVTGDGCVCTGSICAGVPIPGTTPSADLSTSIPGLVPPAISTIVPPIVIPPVEIPPKHKRPEVPDPPSVPDLPDIPDIPNIPDIPFP